MNHIILRNSTYVCTGLLPVYHTCLCCSLHCNDNIISLWRANILMSQKDHLHNFNMLHSCFFFIIKPNSLVTVIVKTWKAFSKMLKFPEITILYFLHLFANSADDCDDPGIPPGALRSGGRFFRGEKLTYRCQTGLDLLGSAERFCLEHREWSGSKPRCHGA